MPTLIEILERVIQVIAKIKNIPPSRIRGTDRLREDLGFTDNGVAALAAPLNEAFAAEGLRLTGDDLLPCKTVNDVVLLIADKLGLMGTGAATAAAASLKRQPKRRKKQTPVSRKRVATKRGKRKGTRR